MGLPSWHNFQKSGVDNYGRWDDHGLARNQSDAANIAVKGNEELEEAVRVANAI